ncbi:uncharacterized protein NECHADRAFT_88022 [Fusarium vanettenii 77-13-4]|uniref:Xylanolytic transcriptional activator regulatory domain-containing protein n=1 Tax=Fusarium vanettenii (strain ATCC MYA-4622 / CBS 123669 / FGSC 9596 / NRRL 45880 / 77-13-4) TaxID=660122 RepID=C7ZN94_FUSV7|nr:uncharacterized protein NECHADRAFT_88022 [Fusarium vanettenii 77-13-4]EEU34528.1 hypothetical protein NECHADRAFT_88022 [Fusarium vanettenii 77-13-4]
MVTCMALSLGYLFQEAGAMLSSEDKTCFALQYYLEHFTSLLGREVDHVCLSNIRAFLLRGYLATFQGKIESATIFTGIACGMAKRIGLHVRTSRLHLDDRLAMGTEGERARRALFHACLWMDRRLAILEGRATFITRIDISETSLLEDLKNDPGIPFMERELSLELVYSFSNPLSKDDAISKGHVTFMTWFNSLPQSMRQVSKGQDFHPSFLSFHLCFHSGLIQLHRPSLKAGGTAASTSHYYCRESAKSISSLLKKYRQHFDNRVMDFMVIHSAFTGALVHLVLLEHPHLASYHSSIRGFKIIIDTLRWIMPWSGYARKVHDNIKKIAFAWGISPVNSATFWAASMGD